MSDFLRPLVHGWLGKIEQARRAREPWLNVANDCLMFFSNSQGFWNHQYLQKMGWSGTLPKFQLTMNRAFEMVATFGPSLFFEAPHRTCEVRKRVPVDPMMFLPPGAPPDHPQVQQMIQQMQMQEAQEDNTRRLTSELMQEWLNYTPWEMPGDGLAQQAQMVIQDALVTGRGVLSVAPYGIPGTDQILTGGQRIDPYRLYLDSDFNSLDDIQWMAIETTAPYWVVERKFQLPPGSLKQACTLESEYSRGEYTANPYGEMHRKSGKTNDLITYYEIYSKTGTGGRLSGMDTTVRDYLEQVTGDFAYLAICKNVPYPLNAPTERFTQGATDDDVRMMFAWPIEYWRDNRWPVALLDFYPHPKSVWPVAPLAPGLGELKFLNIMVSHLCNRIWSSSRDFIAVIESAMKTVEEHLTKGEDLAIIPVPPIFGDIKQMLQVIQFPQVNLDVWRIIEAVSEQFDRRTGLSAILFAMNPGDVQSRSAQDAASKRQAAGVRPAYMQGRVRKWLTQASRMEAICAHAFVRSKDVVQLLGPMRAQLWDQLVASNDIQTIAREFIYTVAAADMRAPDKDRDIANAGQAISMLGPMLQQYAMATSNTQPFNNLVGLWGEAADMDVQGLQLGAWTPPPPPPPVMEQQIQSGQLSIEQQAAEVELTRAKTFGEMVQAQNEKKYPPSKPQPQRKSA